MNYLVKKAIRERLGIIDDGERRGRWTERDSEQVNTLRGEDRTIRDIAEVMRCSTRKVQDVLRGKA